MNCLEFRRTVLADPRHVTDGVREHARDCSSCAVFHEQSRRLNAGIERALRLPVPECLQARILLRRSIGGRQWRWWAGAGLAASLLIGTLAWQLQGQPPPPVQAAVVEYVRQHVALSPVADPASPAALERLFANVGITVAEAAGPIAAAQPCFIDNGRGAHLVIETPRGAVTVLILPQSEVPGPVDFTVGSRLTGRLMPCPKGSIAIISEDPGLIDVVHRRFEGAVGWI